MDSAACGSRWSDRLLCGPDVYGKEVLRLLQTDVAKRCTLQKWSTPLARMRKHCCATLHTQ